MVYHSHTPVTSTVLVPLCHYQIPDRMNLREIFGFRKLESVKAEENMASGLEYCVGNVWKFLVLWSPTGSRKLRQEVKSVDL